MLSFASSHLRDWQAAEVEAYFISMNCLLVEP
jgi:hypothetical protein